MKILITGGAGFIGSHLVAKLVNDHDIIVIDDLSTGRKEFIKEYLDRIRFINSDIVNINSMTLENPDIIFHLAANADVRGGTSDTYIDIEKNILTTHAILEFMKNRCKNIIFTSSATIYGEMGNKLLGENDCDFNPISMYGMSKLAAEKMIHVYHDNYKINARIFRFGNIIGSRNTHGVIRDFVSALKQKPGELTILGDGAQIKQYLDVNDCIDAILSIGMEDFSGFEVFNIAHTELTRVFDLAKIVADEMNLHPVYIIKGGDRGWVGDVPITILDTKKITNLGWEPTISSEESIRKTVRYLMGEDNI